MPAADTVLLPLAVGLTLLGLIIAIFAGRRGSKGRMLQGIALALAPVALYFSGLLRLLWNGVVAVGTWASNVILSPLVWAGLALLALCLVLWVVGGIVARRAPRKPRGAKTSGTKAGEAPAGRTGRQAAVTGGSGAAAKQQAPADDDMAEIEALLKSRGIE